MIIAISAGHDETKKTESLIRRHIRYLNYGLLGLTSMLKHKGQKQIIMFQGDNYTVEELLLEINNAGIDISSECDCFLLSIPSYYSMTWSAKFCEVVHRRYGKRIIVGGRWVVDNHEEWVKDKLKYIDTIISGFGEQKIAKLFNLANWQSIPDGSVCCFNHLDYELLYDYRKYQPCIEVSRGCGSGCQFCADKANKRLPNKEIEAILHELEYLDHLYGEYNVYFEAPHFVFEKKWVEDLCYNLSQRHQTIKWRCTSRVETVPLDLLKIMAESGLRVLDIGLESASPSQLINMRKTNNPELYLRRAEQLLEACEREQIWVKFNLLLYAGETPETIEQTIRWLEDHKRLIKDVSVSNLVYYYNMDSIDDLLLLGASVPEGENIDTRGYIELNLSDQISCEDAKRYTVEIPKLIANQMDFYDIKSISYFEPDYTYSDFINDVLKCNPEVLPFSVDL